MSQSAVQEVLDAGVSASQSAVQEVLDAGVSASQSAVQDVLDAAAAKAGVQLAQWLAALDSKLTWIARSAPCGALRADIAIGRLIAKTNGPCDLRGCVDADFAIVLDAAQKYNRGKDAPALFSAVVGRSYVAESVTGKRFARMLTNFAMHILANVAGDSSKYALWRDAPAKAKPTVLRIILGIRENDGADND